MLPLVLAVLALTADPIKPGKHIFTVKGLGQPREYTMQVPRGYDGQKAIPLVLVLHGEGGTGRGYLDRNGWADKADQEGFVAVCPDALPLGPKPPGAKTPLTAWNTGQLKGDKPRAQPDDVAFLKAVLDDVAKKVNVDKSQVFLAGHGNGAAMAFRLATEAADRFAALATVAGFCPVAEPQPARPLPTLFLVGTKDPLMPLPGGDVDLPLGKQTLPPVSDTVKRWAKALGCEEDARLAAGPRGVQVYEYSGKDDVLLTVWFLTGHGHAWPGGKDSGLPEASLGPNGGMVNATEAIWAFFKRQAKN
jgi:polyhydroxybutyrate depolymerase